MTTFQDKVKALRAHHEELLSRKNEPVEWGNGIYQKYKNPILTAEHTPLEWRYDFDEKSNPYLMQRIMMNATLNSGAIKWNGKYLLVVRVEGADRKSFFAVAESPNGIDNFRFWDEPIPTRRSCHGKQAHSPQVVPLPDGVLRRHVRHGGGAGGQPPDGPLLQFLPDRLDRHHRRYSHCAESGSCQSDSGTGRSQNFQHWNVAGRRSECAAGSSFHFRVADGCSRCSTGHLSFQYGIHAVLTGAYHPASERKPCKIFALAEAH